MQKELSLILACYNEGPTVVDSLAKIKQVLNNTKIKWEGICIDDKSSDNTLNLLKEFVKKNKEFKLITHKKNMGRGGTVAQGMLMSKAKVVGYIDVDLEVSAVYIPEFVEEVRKGSDVVVATRIYKEELASIVRWLASKGYLFIVKRFLGLNLKDTEKPKPAISAIAGIYSMICLTPP